MPESAESADGVDRLRENDDPDCPDCGSCLTYDDGESLHCFGCGEINRSDYAASRFQSVESKEDVHAWLIREDPEEGRLVLCRECVGSYVGSGDAQPVSEEAVGTTFVCGHCARDLSLPERDAS